MSDDLKPCPFCGDPHPGVMVNAVNGTYVHYVLCRCKARATEFVGEFHATLQQAIDAWNTRATPAPHDVQGLIRELRTLATSSTVMDSAMQRAADALAAMAAEIAECHENINLKADFIDATINQLAARDEEIDRRKALVEEAKGMAESYVNDTDCEEPARTFLAKLGGSDAG